MKLLKRITGILFLLTAGLALAFIVSSLVHYDPMMTSFPWWSCFWFAGVYFGPVLALEAAVWLAVRFLEKRKK